jgi:hypothetical protein
MAWQKRALTVPMLGASLVLLRCEDKAGANVDFSKIAKYQSEFGVFNAPEFGLGDIIELDTIAKNGTRIRTVVPQEAEIGATSPITATNIASNITVDISVDASVKNKSDQDLIKAGVQHYASSNTVFRLYNHFRQNLIDPLAPLTRCAGAADDLKRRLTTDGSHLYLVVASLIRADSAQLLLKDSTGNAVSVAFLKIANFSLTVSVNRNSSLDQAARQGALFFKVNQLVWDNQANRIVNQVTNIDLQDYNLTQGLTILSNC